MVAEDDKIDNYGEISKQNTSAALIVTGTLVLTPQAKQPFEIKAEKIEIAGPSTPDYPLQPKRHSLEFLRTITHLRPRTNLFRAVFRVRSVAAQAIHEFFANNGFVYVHTPIITCSDCEGAGEMFKVTTLDIQNPKTPTVRWIFKGLFTRPPTSPCPASRGRNLAMAFNNVYTFIPLPAENSTPRQRRNSG